MLLYFYAPFAWEAFSENCKGKSVVVAVVGVGVAGAADGDGDGDVLALGGSLGWQ